MIIDKIKRRNESLFGSPTGEVITTTYVVSGTYRAYSEFFKESADPDSFRYLFSALHLRQVLANIPKTARIAMLFLPEWYYHPDGVEIVRICRDISPSLLADVFSHPLI